MTVFSSKLAIPLAALLLVTAVAAFALRAAPRQDECASPRSLLDPSAFTPPLRLVEEGPRATRLESGRLTAFWAAASGNEFPVAIVRTYQLPSVVVQPPTALPGRNEADDVRVATLATDAGPVPVHYAYERRGRDVRLTVYAASYRGNAVREPVWTRILEGPSAVRGGSWPITLFVAAAHAHVSQIDERERELESWIALAWSHYQAVCGAAPQDAASSR